jgi:hypothetical protein
MPLPKAASSAAAVPSSEPSSMTITSAAAPRCASTEATASRTRSRRLKVGMITLTRGMAVAHGDGRARRRATGGRACHTRARLNARPGAAKALTGRAIRP